jgi:hypothetical protein
MSTAPVLIEKRKGGRPRKNHHQDAAVLAANPSYLMEGGEIRLLGTTLEQFLATPTQVQRLRYREQLTLPAALEELAKLRAISQIAAEEINQRATPEEDSCMMCGKPMPIGHKPIQMVIVRDAATGTAQTKVLCSIACVRLHNRKRMGLDGAEHDGIAGDIK